MSSRHDRAQRLRREEELYAENAARIPAPETLTDQGLRLIFNKAADRAQRKRHIVENNAVLSLFTGRRYSAEERYAQQAAELLREKRLAKAFLQGVTAPFAQRQEDAPVRIDNVPDESRQRDIVRCSLAYIDRDLDRLAAKALAKFADDGPRRVDVTVPEHPSRTAIIIGNDREYAQILSGHRLLGKGDAYDPTPPVRAPIGM